MPNQARSSVPLDFSLDDATPTQSHRPLPSPVTTSLSIKAGREAGMTARGAAPAIDGRKLRARGALSQLNIRVTADNKDFIMREAHQRIQRDPKRFRSVGDVVVAAMEHYLRSDTV